MLGAWMPQKVLRMLVIVVLGLAFMPLGIAYPHVDSGLGGSANDTVILQNNTALVSHSLLLCYISPSPFFSILCGQLLCPTVEGMEVMD